MESRASVFNLENPARYHLERAPLVQALAQVRFPLVAHLETLAGIAPVQDKLRDLFPFMEQRRQQEFAVQFGAQGQLVGPELETSVAWELSDEEQRLLLLTAGSATVSVGAQYESVEDFAARFRTVVEALSTVESLRRCDRLGVRYLSIAETPLGDESAWARWFRPELTGWIASGVVVPSAIIAGSITQTQMSTPPSGELALCPGDVNALIRHGFVGANAGIPGVPPVTTTQPGYVLDVDVFVAVPQRYDVEQLENQFLALHSQIDRFFRWSLTDEGREYFGYEEVS